MSLVNIGQEITIYFGTFLVLTGLIGNLVNIYIFSKEKTYRKSPCTFYFLIGSIFDIIYITINLISRIVSVGTGFDLTQTSISWCKIRQFSLYTFSLITISCSCLATIDQYFLTSQKASLRHFSNIKWAHRIVSLMIFIWCIHGIFPLIYLEISPVINACTIINKGFYIYTIFYLLGLICLIPVFLMILFGYLIYRNISYTEFLQRQSADRQMTKMIFFKIFLIIISFSPYGIYIAYSLIITSSITKNADRLIKELFASTIISLIPYFYYCGSCYMFLISSSRFRRLILEKIFHQKRTNRVNPTQQLSTLRKQTVAYRTRIET